MKQIEKNKINKDIHQRRFTSARMPVENKEADTQIKTSDISKTIHREM